MDYTQGKLRLYKTGPAGAEVYDIELKQGMIVVESGPMGRQLSRITYPASEKARVDRMVEALITKGYAPLEKTFGPWAQAKAAGLYDPNRGKGKKIGKTFGSLR